MERGVPCYRGGDGVLVDGRSDDRDSRSARGHGVRGSSGQHGYDGSPIPKGGFQTPILRRGPAPEAWEGARRDSGPGAEAGGWEINNGFFHFRACVKFCFDFGGTVGTIQIPDPIYLLHGNASLI